MSSQSGSTDPRWTYDVFLSFRGVDTRETFTSHLHHSLTDAGLIVYMDDRKLGIGEDFSTSVSQAIKESRISLIVFSSGYASSTWCLQELVDIMECRRTNGQVVVPIFYEVDPSYVFHQNGPFAGAFLSHMKRFGEDKIEVWRAALKDAANIAGFDLAAKSRNESEAIENIVGCVSSLLDKAKSLVPRHQPETYDVFLSFRGADVRETFISHLYKRLTNAGFYVYLDLVETQKGEDIFTSVLQAIQASRVAIIVFSKNYASSTWCLRDTEKIMECCRTKGQKVVPVFYDVDPSAVRHQKSPFAEAFHRHMGRFSEDEVEVWRAALADAANISGFVLRNIRNQREAIDMIAERVTSLLHSAQSRVQDVIQLLNYGNSEDVLLLGIWGMAGIGKTTIAKAVYDQISQNFEGEKCLLHIREGWTSDSMVFLQEKLLSCINKTTTKIHSIETGKHILRECLCYRRVFLVLEDVTKLDQLEALCGSREWFGLGSRIIITTRDRHLLTVTGVDQIYEVKQMDYTESVELFSLHAFKKETPKKDFVELVQAVVGYCRGLPLALKVLGSHFFGRNISEWHGELTKLKSNPPDLLDVLKISFDDLSDTEKEILLDIACFFIGMDLKNVVHLLNDSGHSAEIKINVLVQRSLVMIDEKDMLQMHDLLRDMARGIVREVSLNKPKLEYDVFLSFRGKDTLATFGSHLHTSLKNIGINVFKDDDAHRRGEQMSISHLKAIRRSKLSIIIFSRNYVDSRWCLLELENIIECYKTKRQVVVPVFFDVDPADVLNETGIIGKAFQDLLNRISVGEDKVLSWRDALREAGGILGFVVKDSRNRAEDIKKVAECVTRWANRTNLFVADHQVGVQDHLQLLIKLLNKQQSDDVLLLGIWGMGGIGKTTIAKALYNRIGCNFEGSSFLPNIRRAWQTDRHASLQEQLLSDVFLTREIKIPSIELGKILLKEKLRQKKVLLLLDDVHKLEQLNALCGSRKWFGLGSTVIITTRDRCLLTMHGVDQIHTMKEMDESDSTELLSWHAFKQASPRQDFAQLCRGVVSYSGGLPLALVVLGSELFGKEMTKWESVLDGLKTIPHSVVQDVLRISFDDLNDDIHKDLFLDISFFFSGLDRKDGVRALKGYGDRVEDAITVLVDRSLVTVDENKFGVHVLLRKMGREIFREQSRIDPETRSYEVFLSFRGDDTRASFTSHLYTAFENAGIRVFKDDETLRVGDRISISLFQAIGRSQISIVILSENYPNSRWCMLELEKIMECYRTTRQLVVPVFYHVDPSEVRNLERRFGESFYDLLKKVSVEEDKMLRWKTALAKIGAITGPVIVNSRNESEDIKKVVADVTRMVDRTDLSVADHPVGVESRVEDVIQLLDNHQAKDVLFLGIWGMGGIGKTTIAKGIYNRIGPNFEGRSFLLNVRENWEKDNGQVSLQNNLLSHIYKTTEIKIDNIAEGNNTLKERLPRKRILLVLDDVSKPEQLNALCGSHEWFRKGSRIIITTRNKQLAKIRVVKEELARVGSKIYTPKQMDERESIELFSWHAFKQASPSEEFHELSGNVVSYSGGLPLALEVLGSYLSEKKLAEWNSALDKLKIIPNNRVQEKLRISYDGLSDDKEKDIFLDIACFFIGMNRDDVIQILNGCRLFAEIGISVLIERSLVTVDNNNKLGMHDLLRDMGRAIIRGKLLNEPEKRSRLWDADEALDVLKNHTGHQTIEGLALKLPRIETIYTKAFEKMNKLRLLQLAGVKLVGNFKYVSGDLKWLSWHEFPFSHTPTECDQGNLVAIELEYSNLKLVWKEAQLLEKLKILNLSHSHYLTKTPDFKYLPNLEKILLEDCPRLSSVSRTIDGLNELRIINLKDCRSLRKLPRRFYKLKSLATLILSGCSKIDKLEEDLEQMKSLTTLMADNTAIAQVPYALIRLKSIGYISLCGYEGSSRDVFPSIIWSWTSPTNNVSSRMRTSVGLWSCLVSLIVSNRSFQGLLSLYELPKLRSLRLECSSQLQITGDEVLDNLNATNWKELEAMTTTAQVSDIDASAFVDCRSQGDISGSKNSSNFLLIQMGMSFPVAKNLKESIFQKLRTSWPGDCLLPDDNIPNWLTFNSEGYSVTFEVPQVNGRNLKSMMLCIAYSSSTDIITSGGLKKVSIMTQKTTLDYEGDGLTSLKDEDWQTVVSNLEAGSKVQVVIFGYGFIVKKIRIYLIYDETIEKNMDHRHVDAIISGGDDGVVAEMNKNASNHNGKAADKKFTVPGREENRFDRFFKIPSLVRVVLKTWLFWFGLLVLLLWITCRYSEKQESLISFQVSQPTPAFMKAEAPLAQQTEKWLDEEDTSSKSKRKIPSSSRSVVKPVPESQRIEATPTTKTFKPKSEGLANSVQAPFAPTTEDVELALTAEGVDKTHETINISPTSLDLLADPTSPITTTTPIMGAEDELLEDGDSLAELEKILSESYILSPTKVVPAASGSEVQSLSVIAIFQNIQELLDNELEVFVADGDIRKQLLDYVAQLGQMKSQVPTHLQPLINEIRHFYEDVLNNFPSIQEVLGSHQRLVDSKNRLQKELATTKARQTQLSASISKGKERLNEISKEITDLEVKLKTFSEKRDKLQSAVQICEVEILNINKKAVAWLKEGKEIVSTLKASESAFNKAESLKQNYERKLADLKRDLGNIRP